MEEFLIKPLMNIVYDYLIDSQKYILKVGLTFSIEEIINYEPKLFTYCIINIPFNHTSNRLFYLCGKYNKINFIK
jgi:hypothetical protein